MKDTNTPEPIPIANDREAIWNLVIEDMHERNKVGIDKMLEQYARNVGECEKAIESIANGEGVEGIETSGEVS
jgi:hypothetical protein